MMNEALDFDNLNLTHFNTQRRSFSFFVYRYPFQELLKEEIAMRFGIACRKITPPRYTFF